MEHIRKICTLCRQECQLENGIIRTSINFVSQRLQEHVNPVVDQTPSSPEHVPVSVKEPPRKRNLLRKRRRRGDQAINPTNGQQVEADTEVTLASQDTAQTNSSTSTWLRNWLGKFINTSNNPPSQTPNSSYLPRIFSFRRAQKSDRSPTSSTSTISGSQSAISRSISSIFCLRSRPESDSPPVTPSNSTLPNTPDTPNTLTTTQTLSTPPSFPAPSPPRPSSLTISCDINQVPATTTTTTTTTAAAAITKRKRRSLTVHWRNSTPNTDEHLPQDQHLTGGNKRSRNRQDSAGIWNEALNDGAENQDEWFDADDSDRMLLENWSLHHRALVEEWRGS